MTTPTINIHVQQAGLHSTIQDLGRPGYQAQGIPIGGALDRHAAIQANYLVGNALHEPVLEITLLGPVLHFEQACQIAITGADLSPSVDGQPVSPYQTISLQAGASLRFGKAQSGCRTYLAIRGQWLTQKWLGSASRATQHPSLLTPDSLLQKNHLLRILSLPAIPTRLLPPRALPERQQTELLNVLPGPEFEHFERKDIAHFFAQSYTVTPQSNRMGYRLEPAVPDFVWPRENISSGIVPGTIQITNSGQAIVLLADAQTVGGYPRIANLDNDSLDQIAQLCPGEQLRFRLKTRTNKPD